MVFPLQWPVQASHLALWVTVPLLLRQVQARFSLTIFLPHGLVM
jgi:hypothetical protein